MAEHNFEVNLSDDNVPFENDNNELKRKRYIVTRKSLLSEFSDDQIKEALKQLVAVGQLPDPHRNISKVETTELLKYPFCPPVCFANLRKTIRDNMLAEEEFFKGLDNKSRKRFETLQGLSYQDLKKELRDKSGETKGLKKRRDIIAHLISL